ncbi:MAG: C69 family dipeptidase [Clostridia bacterium]|nr:C69 family dipeptidase [Clostridia bacterium]
MKSLKTVFAMMIALVLMLGTVSASACTAIYVGSDLTEDGSTLFARSEDYSNSYAKVMYVSPAGEYKAGEEYIGCYGFTYVWPKDSYSFTTFSDDNWEGSQNICPDCGETHKHNPYGAAGTNEMGVSMSATETLYCSVDAVYDLDPFTDIGIEEAEITTVVLSQAATAKEGVEILLGIYDSVGCNNGSGIFIADNTETWYIENLTGTQYVAVKLSSSVAFANPNQNVIGLIDLDDTENVIASANLIAIAKQAGTFVGNEEENQIDYQASYNGEEGVSSRMVDALNFMYGTTDKTAETITPADYTISNVDENGSIVPFHSNIALTHKYDVSDIVAYYHIPSIGKAGNTENHIFQIFSEDSKADTVEWVSMDHGGYSPFVPFLPMLTSDTEACYKASCAPAAFVTEEPTEGWYYKTTGRIYTEEGRKTVDGFKVLPENWEKSLYWTMDALSNAVESGKFTEEQIAEVNAKMAELQNLCYDAYDTLMAAAAGDDAVTMCTMTSATTAFNVHQEALKLLEGIQ